MCFRETPFTALQQGDINDLLRVSVPVQINRVIIINCHQTIGAITGLKRELGTSVVVYEDLGVASPGKVETSREHKQQNKREY